MILHNCILKIVGYLCTVFVLALQINVKAHMAVFVMGGALIQSNLLLRADTTKRLKG